MRPLHAAFCFWLFCQACFVLITAFDPISHRYWSVMIVQPIWPPFGDLRVLLKGWVLDAQGMDPLAANVAEASFNYPRLWLLPGRFGLSPLYYRWFGFALVCLFLASAAWMTRRCGKWALIAVWLFSLSGSWWLGLERANTDLVIFSLLVVSLSLLEKEGLARGAGASGVLLCAFLKLYPAALFPLLWRGWKRGRKAWVFVPIALFGVYLCATLPDVVRVLHKTSQGDNMSYGVPIAVRFCCYFASGGTVPGSELVHLGQVGVSLLSLGAAAWGWKRLALPPGPSMTNLRFFSAGASLYVFTFLAQTNWSYRLCFLVFVIPALGAWLGVSSRRRRSFFAVSLLLTISTCWMLNSSRVGIIVAGHGLSFLLSLILCALGAAAARRLFRHETGLRVYSPERA